MSPTDWLLRVNDGENFRVSSILNTWGIRLKNEKTGKQYAPSQNFLKNVKPGDRLWFIISKSNGKAIAVATFSCWNERTLHSLKNIDLGWEYDNKYAIKHINEQYWDIEIKYDDLYFIEKHEIYTYIKGAATIRKFNDKCKVNLQVEYYTKIHPEPGFF